MARNIAPAGGRPCRLLLAAAVLSYNAPMGRSQKQAAKAILFVLAAGTAFSHQPRLVDDKPSIEVRRPEISQAFYARLDGSPQTYTIRSEAPFRLYVNLLVPDLPGIDTDYEAVISRKAEPRNDVLARLDGRSYGWRPFFEPFGGDHYRLGPEYEDTVPPGTYIIVVSSPDNQGRYVLAVGKTEKFPPGEMARTIVALPKLKRYFGKSPWTAFFNLSGLFLVLVTAVLGGPATLFFLIRRRRRRRRAAVRATD